MTEQEFINQARDRIKKIKSKYTEVLPDELDTNYDVQEGDLDERFSQEDKG